MMGGLDWLKVARVLHRLRAPPASVKDLKERGMRSCEQVGYRFQLVARLVANCVVANRSHALLQTGCMRCCERLQTGWLDRLRTGRGLTLADRGGTAFRRGRIFRPFSAPGSGLVWRAVTLRRQYQVAILGAKSIFSC